MFDLLDLTFQKKKKNKSSNKRGEKYCRATLLARAGVLVLDPLFFHWSFWESG